MANKLSEKGIASAAAVITFILSILCLIVVFAFKDSAFSLFNLFFHGIDLSKIKAVPDLIRGILGSIILAIIAYVSGWIFAVVYNKFAK